MGVVYSENLRASPFIVAPALREGKQSTVIVGPSQLASRADEVASVLHASIGGLESDRPFIGHIARFGGRILIATTVRSTHSDSPGGRRGLEFSYGAWMDLGVLKEVANPCAATFRYMNGYLAECGISPSVSGIDEFVRKEPSLVDDNRLESASRTLLRTFAASFGKRTQWQIIAGMGIGRPRLAKAAPMASHDLSMLADFWDQVDRHLHSAVGKSHITPIESVILVGIAATMLWSRSATQNLNERLSALEQQTTGSPVIAAKESATRKETFQPSPETVVRPAATADSVVIPIDWSAVVQHLFSRDENEARRASAQLSTRAIDQRMVSRIVEALKLDPQNQQGVFRALAHLERAKPTSLFADSTELMALFDRVSENGEKTAALVDRLRQRVRGIVKPTRGGAEQGRAPDFIPGSLTSSGLASIKGKRADGQSRNPSFDLLRGWSKTV